MNKKTITTFIIAAAALPAAAQVPAASTDVMLQGFYWDAMADVSVSWWNNIESQAEDIAKSFDLIWLPPSSLAENEDETNVEGIVGNTNDGYHPRIWNNQNSAWGLEDDLKSLITTLHNNNVKVIADIVVNHRAGYTSWATFAYDDFEEFGTFQLDASHICSDDELNSDTSAGSEYGTATGAADTGVEEYTAARDLDHTSEYVQQDIIAYEKWLKDRFGYDGWRYDLVKGYGGQYVDIYNTASAPYLSVGEYWDGTYDNVKSWLEAANYNSMAFDFPGKYAAFNNGLANTSFSNMAWQDTEGVWRPAGLIHSSDTKKYAVTFVDNHDTYRDDSKYTGDILKAYAFLLSAPGIPCVFYPHWTNSSYKEGIENMIAARKAAGITSESDVEVTQYSTYYECLAKGTKKNLICRIGRKAASLTAPDGYELACSGTQWYYYLSTTDNALPTIKASDDPNDQVLAVYSLDGRKVTNGTNPTNPGLYIAVTKNSSYKIVIK